MRAHCNYGYNYLTHAAPLEAEVGSRVHLGVWDGGEVASHHKPVGGWQELRPGEVVRVVGVLTLHHHSHVGRNPERVE